MRMASLGIGDTSSGSVEEFAAYLDQFDEKSMKYVKGVRQVMHTQPPETCTSPHVIAKAKLCGDRGIVFELCMACDQLADVAVLAQAAPKTHFVLDHCGGHHQLAVDDPRLPVWKAGIEAVAKCDNVWCKISGLMGAQGGTE
eukprot:CAMPEP_0197848630 /NCGR_PEP_ID=MMETSP1438-20131217/9407_1 /TAXON_ID=1461541 /ORGANISM="Pterosperma sp., Strain CCMP1384" /LENGTH=141 /DNA_ID=CAMNT_0043460973 /DNA_START=149 /DNA_END=572 /DNA_ORIENTATION=-